MRLRKHRTECSNAGRDGASPRIDDTAGRDTAGRSGEFTRDPAPVGLSAFHHKDPAWVLAEAAVRLQVTVGELETLMFEATGVGADSRAQIHDAVALVMEALQALDLARTALPRSSSLGAPLAACLLDGPLARAWFH